jgi:hypothetical protein
MYKGRIAEHHRIAGIKSMHFKDCEEHIDLEDFGHDDKCHEDACFIMAYVDDELDEDGRRIIESMIESDPKAKETAEALRSVTTLLREAFLEPLAQRRAEPFREE